MKIQRYCRIRIESIQVSKNIFEKLYKGIEGEERMKGKLSHSSYSSDLSENTRVRVNI